MQMQTMHANKMLKHGFMLAWLILSAPALPGSSSSSRFPGPPHLHPQLHYTPACLNPQGTSGGSRDIAGALTVRGEHNVWQLCPQGWHRATSVDLVHWRSLGIGPNAWPSGFVTVDEDSGGVCAGMRGSKPIPGGPSTDAALVLRCLDVRQNSTTWGPEEPLFEVRFYRFLPFDPLPEEKTQTKYWHP